MKILSRGNKHKKEYKGTCARCGSVVSAPQHELKIEYDRDGDFAIEYCPVCHEDNIKQEIFLYAVQS